MPELHTASLELSSLNLHGVGNHSWVYRAPFLPPAPLVINSRSATGHATVIVKTSFPGNQNTEHLENEAAFLGDLSMDTSRHLQQEWCGLNLLPGMTRPVPVGPVVPKFYGCYIPDLQDTGASWAVESIGLLLLMEDCGMPIEKNKLSMDAK